MSKKVRSDALTAQILTETVDWLRVHYAKTPTWDEDLRSRLMSQWHLSQEGAERMIQTAVSEDHLDLPDKPFASSENETQSSARLLSVIHKYQSRKDRGGVEVMDSMAHRVARRYIWAVRKEDRQEIMQLLMGMAGDTGDDVTVRRLKAAALIQKLEELLAGRDPLGPAIWPLKKAHDYAISVGRRSANGGDLFSDADERLLQMVADQISRHLGIAY